MEALQKNAERSDDQVPTVHESIEEKSKLLRKNARNGVAAPKRRRGRPRKPKRPNKTGRDDKTARFIYFEHWIWKHPAFQALHPRHQVLIFAFEQRHDGHNNGDIGFSVREVADCIKSGKDLASRTLRELEEAGWIACNGVGYLGPTGRGFSSRWRLTWRRSNPALGAGAYQDAETNDFARLSAKEVEEILKRHRAAAAKANMRGRNGGKSASHSGSKN
jgi:hypothetical protein